jgi:hypothetical protein
MYFLTAKMARVRNLSVSAANGAISLTILLIAPMGLFAVIVNTLLIMAATYGSLTASDRVISYLQRDQQRDSQGGQDRFGASRSGDISRRDRNDLDR